MAQDVSMGSIGFRGKSIVGEAGEGNYSGSPLVRDS
jgi:hypothetical protein